MLILSMLKMRKSKLAKVKYSGQSLGPARELSDIGTPCSSPQVHTSGGPLLPLATPMGTS